jgi:hypothetical protein
MGALGQRQGEKAIGHALRRRQARWVFAGEGAGAQPSTHNTGIDLPA